MKILKYVAVLASAMLVSLTYAADAQSNDPVKVSVKNDNGAVSVSISVDVKNPTVSCEEALKDVLKKALAAVGADTLNGKAISAAMVAINAALADKNAPALGPVEVSFVVKNKVEELVNVAEVAANVAIAGEKYQVNTETRYNPATQTSDTVCNVTAQGENGATTSMPVIFAVDSNGTVKGSVGNTQLVDSSSNAQNPLTTPPATDVNDVLPDNTIVTSASN